MKAIPYTLSNESVTVVVDGKSYTVNRKAPNFTKLRKAILDERWGDIPKHVTIKNTIEDWAKGKFSVSDNVIYYNGEALPAGLNGRIIDTAAGGNDPSSFFKFWEKLQTNPSKRSVDQLWAFLEHQGIPLTKDGNFLAYKGVRNDFKDQHSGTFDNKPGNVHEMPRNKISDDPREACHEGFHVGALGYANGFSQRVVICEVDPADVVCVPYDESNQKMRVCKYKVIGLHNGQELSSTVHEEDVYEDVDLSDLDEEDDQSTDELDEDDGDHRDSEYGEDYDFEDDCRAGAPEAEKEEYTPPKRKSKRGFAKYDKMDNFELLDVSLEELRRYAGKGLQIVGASKILGGKTALVSAIIKARK